MLSNIPDTDIKFLVTYTKFGFYEAEMTALGGYRKEDTTFLLIRHFPEGYMPKKDGLAKLAPGNRIIIGDHNDREYLTDECWENFDRLDEGDYFRLGGEKWQKLYLCDVRAAVGGKTLRVC